MYLSVPIIGELSLSILLTTLIISILLLILLEKRKTVDNDRPQRATLRNTLGTQDIKAATGVTKNSVVSEIPVEIIKPEISKEEKEKNYTKQLEDKTKDVLNALKVKTPEKTEIPEGLKEEKNITGQQEDKKNVLKTKTPEKTEIPEDLKEEKNITEQLENKTKIKLDEYNAKDVLKEPVVPVVSGSSSGSEEDVTRALGVTRAPRVSRRPKKHACKGSVVLCASKRKVTAVTIVTDSVEEEVKVSLEDLAGEIRGVGVTCTVHPATTHTLPTLSTEPSHLLLLFGTTSEGCGRLQGGLRAALGGDAAPLPPQPFLYSVSCWSATPSGEVFEAASALSASLGGCGGAEWLPMACITPAEGGAGESVPPEPPVMARHQYLNTVMDKMTKPGKKCCGTSCGSKTVDIEDLASSLLLSQATVTS